MQIAGKHQMAGVRREITSKRYSQSMGQVRRKIKDSYLIGEWRTSWDSRSKPHTHAKSGQGVSLLRLTDEGWEVGKGRSRGCKGIRQLVVDMECLGLCEIYLRCLWGIAALKSQNIWAVYTQGCKIKIALVLFNHFNYMVIENFEGKRKAPKLVLIFTFRYHYTPYLNIKLVVCVSTRLICWNKGLLSTRSESVPLHLYQLNTFIGN